MISNRMVKHKVTDARGVALIDATLATLRKKKSPSNAPLDPRTIDAMRLADGTPLPDSLKKFLSVHGPGESFPGNWRAGEGGALEHVSFETLLRRQYDDEALSYFDVSELIASLPGRCHPLEGDTPLSFLYIGRPDPWGEYPILTLQDYDDVLEVVVSYPGLDLYLACRAGAVPAPSYHGGIIEHEAYGPMMVEAVKHNFPGLTKRRKQFTWNATYIERDDE
jgi:hypothetical protein